MQETVLNLAPLAPYFGILLIFIGIYFFIRTRENVIADIMFSNENFLKKLGIIMNAHCETKHLEHQDKLMDKIKTELINPLMIQQNKMQESMSEISKNVANITGKLEVFLDTFKKN